MTHHRPTDGIGVAAWIVFAASLLVIAVFAFLWFLQTVDPTPGVIVL